MVRGRYDDGFAFDALEKVRRAAGTAIAFDISPDDTKLETHVSDAATGDSVILSAGDIGGTSTGRMLLTPAGAIAATRHHYTNDHVGETSQIVICNVSDCEPVARHIYVEDPTIDLESLHREGDKGCWIHTGATGTPETQCAALAPKQG